MGLKYAFPCTGRSGSKYIQDLMTRCGIKCGHEDVYRIRNIIRGDDKEESSWAFTRDPDGECDKFDAESSFVMAPFLNDPPCRNSNVIHVVRNPLHVIDSWRHQQGMGSFLFMGKFCEFQATDYVSFCAGMYVAWNRHISSQDWGAHPMFIRRRVEDPEAIMEAIGADIVVGEGEKRELPPTNINSVGSKRITKMDDIRDAHIRKAIDIISEEYGYELS